jgi:hypothetical protein
VTTKPSPGLNPVRLEIPDHWTPETALAVFELINDLRDQITRQMLPQCSSQHATGWATAVSSCTYLRAQGTLFGNFLAGTIGLRATTKSSRIP